MAGRIPVVGLQFADFGLVAGDEIFHKLAKWRYMHGGKLELPAVVRLPTGGVGGAGAEHSPSLQARGGGGARRASRGVREPNTPRASRRWECRCPASKAPCRRRPPTPRAC